MSDPTEQQPQKSIFEQAAELEADEVKVPEAGIQLKPAEFGIDLTDHKPEHDVKSDADLSAGIVIPEQPDHPGTALRNPAIGGDPASDLRDEVIAPFKATFTIGEVEVTSAEKDRFVRASLHDEEMIFDVELEGMKIRMEVAIPTESFTVAVANALHKWGELGILDIASDMQWWLGFQQIHCLYQIRSVNGKPTAWSELFADGLPKVSVLRKFIADPENFDEILNMGAPRWRTMVNAMAVAEHKYKLCLDAWRTRDFFAKADTA